MSYYREMLLKQEEKKKYGISNHYAKNVKTPSTGNVVIRLFSTIIAVIIGLGVYAYSSNLIKSTKTDIEKGSKNSTKSTQVSKSIETANPAINDISIESVKIEENSIGIPLLYVVFQNNGEKTIDRIDFRLKCFNAYGELIRPSILSDEKQYFFDTNLKPGYLSDKDRFLSLGGFSGARSVEIAVIKYHTTNGETIEVPSKLLKYHRYTFN